MIHAPTGRTVRQVLRRENGRVFCDFGEAANPFTWVELSELRDRCQLCGDLKMVDRSCICFDNHCS